MSGGFRADPATLKLPNTEDGHAAMLAYSSPERLVACRWEAQPRLCLPANRVANPQQLRGADVTLSDVSVPPDMLRATGFEEA